MHKRGRDQFIFPNASGIDKLPNCTATDISTYNKCRALILSSFDNATEALKIEINNAISNGNGTLVAILKQEFWCTEAVRHIRLLGACVQPCRTNLLCQPLPLGSDGREVEGDQPPPPTPQGGLQGPHCFTAGYDDAHLFCRTGMNQTQTVDNGFNTEPDLEVLMNNFTCAVQPTCSQLVQQGLNVALLSYQANVLSSNAINAVTSSLIIVASLISVMLMF